MLTRGLILIVTSFILVAVITIFKYLLFKKYKSRRYRFLDTFYFSQKEITLTSSSRRKKYKIKQNNLSCLGMFILFFMMIMLFLIWF